MSNKTFTTREFQKYGIIRRKDLDFSDDGTRFSMYEYKGLLISAAKYENLYFLSIRINEADVEYDVYKKWKEYELCDIYNGVDAEKIDADRFFEVLTQIYNKIQEYKGEPVEVEAEVVEHTEEETTTELSKEEKEKRRRQAYCKQYAITHKEKIQAYCKAYYQRKKAAKTAAKEANNE